MEQGDRSKPAERATAPARILAVDDEPGLLQFLCRLLQSRGHKVYAAKDGQDGLELLADMVERGEAPDLVISDVQMPRLDGIAMCRVIRERFDRKKLPLVLVSVLESEDDILRGFEAGANDYLTKPYGAGVLLAKVSVLLHERELLPDTTSNLAPLIEDDGPLTPPFLFDRYDVQAEIGRGGMGVVYRARDRDDGRLVALKLLSPTVARDRHGLARFLREVAALQEVRSELVVRALDSGMERGRYFLAMNLVEGPSAKQKLVEQGPFHPHDAAMVGRDIALALAILATKGLVHRDVKPSNFIIKPDRHATLVDFGLVRSQEKRDLTETGEAIGTPHYLAPEVVQGGPSDARADLYALGVSLFELIAGRKPYTGRTHYEIFNRALAGPSAEILELRPDLPLGLADVIRGLMERNPEKRLRPAEAVARALETYAGPPATHAPEPGT